MTKLRRTAAIFWKAKECGSLPRSRYAVGTAYSGEMIFRTVVTELFAIGEIFYKDFASCGA
jgi:hypothetical protein